MMTEEKELYLGCAAVILCTELVGFVQNTFLMDLPLPVRMISMILLYWLIGLVPFLLIRRNHERFSEYGFSRNHLGIQIFTGTEIALVMSLFLTLLPHLLGFGEFVDSGIHLKYAWQYVYELVYDLFAVGATEEFVFRGFIFQKLYVMTGKEKTAVIGSSIAFGLFHLLSGNIVQMLMTGVLGALWCLCRLKLRNCTTLSLIIAHGMYDFLIVVWSSLL